MSTQPVGNNVSQILDAIANGGEIKYDNKK